MSIVDRSLYGTITINGRKNSLGKMTLETMIRKLILTARETNRRGFSSLTFHVSINESAEEISVEDRLMAEIISQAESVDEDLDPRWEDPKYLHWIRLQNPRLMADEPFDAVQTLRAYIESAYPDAPGL